MTTEKNDMDEPAHGPGFAAFIDVHDSTYAWDQNADTARGMIVDLYKTVEAATDRDKGWIGNFTGDGFLLLFTGVENCILCLSRIIQDWEGLRGEYGAKYKASGVFLPDDYFLALRTGVSFGNFEPLAIKDKIHYAGSGINKAQRCEAASKEYFRRKEIGGLRYPHYVFIDSSAENLILARTGFVISEQLPAEFKGYVQAGAGEENGELENRKQFIYAVWPKSGAGIKGKAGTELGKFSAAQTSVDIGDRLLAAAKAVSAGPQLQSISNSAVGKTRENMLREIADSYRDALRVYTLDAFPGRYAETQNKLGCALRELAGHPSGQEKKKVIEESLAAFKEALRVYTFEAMPENYARTQNNLGVALQYLALFGARENRKEILEMAEQAHREALRVYAPDTRPEDYARAQNNLSNVLKAQVDHLSGAEMRKKLEETIQACREALRIRTMELSPADYAETQCNLGVALKKRAEFLSGAEKRLALEEAASALRMSLRVYTFDSANPGRYAAVRNNLGNTLTDLFPLLAREELDNSFAEAIRAYNEALRVFRPEASPIHYGATQNNMGRALKCRADLLAGDGKRAMLEEAVKAHEKALQIYTFEFSNNYYALAQGYLGDALKSQAELLSGAEKQRKIETALKAYSEALRVYTETNYPEKHRLITAQSEELIDLRAGQ